MQDVVSSNKDWLDVLMQVLIVVIPVVITNRTAVEIPVARAQALVLWKKILTGQIFKINRFLLRSEVYCSNMTRLVFQGDLI